MTTTSTTATTPRQRLVALGLALVLLANLAWGWHHHRQILLRTGEQDGAAAMRELQTIVQVLRENYVDPDKVGYRQLLHSAATGMVGALDPFSMYAPPAEYREVQQQIEGRFGGIGVVVAVIEGRLTVLETTLNSPGAAAGLQPQDQILAVDGESSVGQASEHGVRRIRGEPGTRVTLSVFRPATQTLFEVSVERAVIEVPTVVGASYLEPGIAYLRLTQFSEKTILELADALVRLDPTQMRGLVLDVRFNPGGLLESAQQVSSLFLAPNQLICYTEGRDPKRRKYYYAQGGPLRLPDVPLVVLINGSSASAAEILAGCLHDHGRATLIGEKTFGKGTVQEPLPLAGGSVLHLTVARYYTPSKQVIHGRGIEPDLPVPVADDKDHQFYRADGGGPEAAHRDVQLRRALAWLHERLLQPAPEPPPLAP